MTPQPGISAADAGEHGRRFADALLERARMSSISIPVEAVPLLAQYYALLARWNRTVNLTSLRLDNYEPEALDRLFLEPLAAAAWFPPGKLRWFDLGSGGGSPAIPLKVVRPEAGLVMIESRSRKVAFLREAIRTLAFERATAEARRFEDLTADTAVASTADVVTVRAVKADESFYRAVAHILKPTAQVLVFESVTAGRLMLWHHVASHRLVGEAQLSIYSAA